MREEDLLIISQRGFKRKVERARELIKKALKQSQKPYLSWSTGKDSTAMLVLVAEQKPDITVMMYDSGYELPENKSYAEYVTKLLGIKNVEIVRPPEGLDPLEEKVKAGFYDLKAIAKVNERVMMKPIRGWAQKGGYDLAFIGLRKEESIARRSVMKMNGELHWCKKNKIWQCYPMADFTGEEVFALLAYFGIKPHPVYDKTKFKERKWVRVNWWIQSAGAEKGAVVWLRYYYPELYQKLAERNPEAKNYT